MRKINHYFMKLTASCFVCLLACRCVPIVPMMYNQLPPVCFCLCLFLCVPSLALIVVRRTDFIVSLYLSCSFIHVLYLFSFKSVFIVTITRDGLAMHHNYKYCISLYILVYPCILIIVYQCRVHQSASLTARFCYWLITMIRKINNFLTFYCYATHSCPVLWLDEIIFLW